MNHYTYEIKFENGMKYLGVRSCKCPVEQDVYTGSSKLIPPELYATCKKTILATFSTRIEAQENEITRHAELDVARNPEYYNGINAKSTGFSPIGLTKERSEKVKLRAEKFRSYRGNNRTEAQKQADIALSKYKDTKNPSKGNSGTDNAQFKPWYYITPEGVYTQVNEIPIRQYCESPECPEGFKASRIYERISTCAHQPFIRGQLKGYVFGYVHTKPDYINQENIDIAYKLAEHIIIPDFHKMKMNRKTNLISNITGKR